MARAPALHGTHRRLVAAFPTYRPRELRADLFGSAPELRPPGNRAGSREHGHYHGGPGDPRARNRHRARKNEAGGLGAARGRGARAAPPRQHPAGWCLDCCRLWPSSNQALTPVDSGSRRRAECRPATAVHFFLTRGGARAEYWGGVLWSAGRRSAGYSAARLSGLRSISATARCSGRFYSGYNCRAKRSRPSMGAPPVMPNSCTGGWA